MLKMLREGLTHRFLHISFEGDFICGLALLFCTFYVLYVVAMWTGG